MRRLPALGVCLTAAFMSGLDVSIVNVALPSIEQSLHATEDGLQWVLSGYALTFGLLLVPAGRLGDARSRRTMFMIGVTLFTLASTACGFAPTTHLLIAARLVQGIGAGLLNPQVSGLIQQMFQGQERGRAFGAFGATMGVATAAGPAIGGALVTLFGAEYGWRWVFLVNLPIGVILLPLAWKLLPAPGPALRRRQQSMDPVGVFLLGLGVFGLLLPFIQQHQWDSQAKWLLVPAALLTLTAFVTWERHYGREPLVQLDLFSRRSYRLGAAIGMLYFAGFTGIPFTYTLFLQSGLGYTPLEAGLAITPFALGSALAALAGGRLVARAGRRVVAAGLTIVLAGLAATIAVTFLAPAAGLGWYTAPTLLVTGLGSGLVISPNQAITLSEVPPEHGGSAAGVLQTGQRLGTSFGIAATGSIFFGAVGEGWPAAFRNGLVMVLVFVAAALAAALHDLSRSRGKGPVHRP
ncbi:MFS transporter [Nonomuraea typhae]|uniref:MFS transporter n=1 Tax=Nonomuraea typhae TaxID=2603600 RepID=UPI002483CEAF|nr:MFS transporter [Nonomuraea typhae]